MNATKTKEDPELAISSTTELGQLLLMKAYLKVAPNIIAQHYPPGCCIAATRITLDTLGAFSIPGEPMSVDTVVCNPEYTRRLSGAVTWPGKETSKLWYAEGAVAAQVGAPDYELGIDKRGIRPGNRTGSWAGHLVACLYVGENIYMADLSITGANDPLHDIRLPEIIALVSDNFMLGDAVRGVSVVPLENGCSIIYKSKPEDTSFKSTSDWTARRHKSTVGAIIRAIKRVKHVELGRGDFSNVLTPIKTTD